jgi:segregation and condensation protein B
VKFLEFCGIKSLEELPATDVVSPAQLNEWIRRAIEPESQQDLISDADMGLPTENLEPSPVAEVEVPSTVTPD